MDERVEAGLSVRRRMEETRQRRKAYSEDLGLTFGAQVPCLDSYVAAAVAAVAVATN